MSRQAPPPTSSAPLRAEAEVAIVGGGIMGLALAYNLTERGVTDVVVLRRTTWPGAPRAAMAAASASSGRPR
jgi:glycine/D-amino acid oxidase-like deaminating enzyme